MAFELAQVNVARLVAPLDDPALAGFVAALDPVNAAADRAPGFIWRLQTEEGNATSVEAFTWDAGSSAGVIVNMSVWTDVEHLGNFVYGELHRQVLRRRRQWFQFIREAWMACWWVPSGYRPSTGEAEDADPVPASTWAERVCVHAETALPASGIRSDRGARRQRRLAPPGSSSPCENRGVGQHVTSVVTPFRR